MILAICLLGFAFGESGSNVSDIVEHLRAGKSVREMSDDITEFIQSFNAGEAFTDLIDSLPFPELMCYDEILAGLKTDCALESEEESKRIALRLTKCFYNLSGMIHLFPVNESESSQTGKMSGSVYSIYLMMKFHWTNLCHFSKNMAFTEEVSHNLVQLFRSMISWSPIMKEFRQEMREIVRQMKLGVDDLGSKAQNLTATTSSIRIALSDLRHYIETASDLMDLALFLVDNLTFYFTTLVLFGFFGIVIPRIVGPAVFTTILVFIADRCLIGRFEFWRRSSVRNIAHCAYAAFWLIYPVITIARFASARLQKFHRKTCSAQIQVP
jgi:hypothetical protein